MKPSYKALLLALPLALALAGCKTTQPSAAQSSATASPAQATRTQAQQGASIDVFLGTNTATRGYRPLKLNNKRTIYVSPRALFTREQLTGIDVVKTDGGAVYIKLSLNPAGVAALAAAPAKQGLVTAVGGALVSLTGLRQGNDFLFAVQNEQAAGAIVRAIVPQQAQARPSGK